MNNTRYKNAVFIINTFLQMKKSGHDIIPQETEQSLMEMLVQLQKFTSNKNYAPTMLFDTLFMVLFFSRIADNAGGIFTAVQIEDTMKVCAEIHERQVEAGILKE